MVRSQEHSTQTVPAPLTLVVGGDSFLNNQRIRDLRHAAAQIRPDAEIVELDAAQCDAYAFDEAVGPSLLSDSTIVILSNVEHADDKLAQTLQQYCKHSKTSQGIGSVVIAQHEGGQKGKRLLDALTRAGADRQNIPDLKKFDAKINFVYSTFERKHRRIEPMAAQQLVNVLGDDTGQLAAMCEQLCFDFDENPITLNTANTYLTADPQVTGFAVADKAVEGRTADAIVAMRAAVTQGIVPIALIGALALKLRMLAKAAAIQSGSISQAEAKASPWQIRAASRQLSGWTSAGLGRCIEALAAADESSKSSRGDPVYALELAIELIGTKGRLGR
ncbi:MAG: DNA polymerase III subunit delta [Bifidobacterium sp.]|jgi:DNA polymerase-3 subunit delta|nr:DNA polymerase III subunit delta [Bifidobacterium sp.]MCH4175772.1 DNA polymerase III subunit delta [Bifidobacterium sp.]